MEEIYILKHFSWIAVFIFLITIQIGKCSFYTGISF